MFTTTVVDTWFDGTAINDSKVDNAIYFKNTIANGGGYSIHNGFKATKEIDIRRYGLLADGTLHTISELLPYVTLAQVQSIEPTATLNNSADWYVIQMLLKILPIQSTILLRGNFVIDREIILKRGKVKFLGLNTDKPNIYGNYKSTIKQVSTAKDHFKCIDGDGTYEGIGIGHVDYLEFENFFLYGTKTVSIISGDGFSFHLSNNGLLGTAIYWDFKNIKVFDCSYGFKHYTGHINSFSFTNCGFNYNYNCGFKLNGNSTNQTNHFNFYNCKAQANGQNIVDGLMVDYTQIINSPNYEKAGVSIEQVTALNFNGCDVTGNHGAGLVLNSGAHLGIFIGGYGEFNILGDILIKGGVSLNNNINVGSFYSYNKNIIFENEIVRRNSMPQEYGLFNETNSLKIFSENKILNSKACPITNDNLNFTEATLNGSREITVTGTGLQRFYVTSELEVFKNGDKYLQSVEIFTNDISLIFADISFNGGAPSWNMFNSPNAENDKWVRVYKLITIVDDTKTFLWSIYKQSTATLKFRNPSLQKYNFSGESYREESIKYSQLKGTTNKMLKFLSTNSTGDSIVSDNGTYIDINGYAQSQGLKFTKGIDVSSQNLDLLTVAGFYTGNNLTNAPNNGYFYIEVQRNNFSNSYAFQRLTSYGLNNQGNMIYTRIRVGDLWGSWACGSPRLSTSQRDSIISPFEGMEIYNLTTSKKNFYNGTVWEQITSV
jgi:hypothetical protein